MTRPRGEIRQALAAGAYEIASSSPMGGAHWREVAVRANVGFDAACRTWHEMRRAGELLDVSTVSVGHSCRPMVLCRPAALVERTAASAAQDLTAAMRSWAEFA